MQSEMRNLKRKRDKWSIIFFGLTTQILLLWNWFFQPDNYWIFIIVGVCFLIGLIEFKVYFKKINKIKKSHKHKYDNSYHCKVCGIYWDLKSCIYCNSRDIKYIRKEEELNYFKRSTNLLECNLCKKSVNIDSYSTTTIKGLR